MDGGADVDLSIALWDIIKGLNITERASKIHSDGLEAYIGGKMKACVGPLRTVHNMSKLSLSSSLGGSGSKRGSTRRGSSNTGSETVLKVDSGGDDQPHVTTMSEVIRQVSKVMTDTLDAGFTGIAAFRVLQLLHKHCVDQLVAIIEMFMIDRKVCRMHFMKIKHIACFV